MNTEMNSDRNSSEPAALVAAMLVLIMVPCFCRRSESSVYVSELKCIKNVLDPDGTNGMAAIFVSGSALG